MELTHDDFKAILQGLAIDFEEEMEKVLKTYLKYNSEIGYEPNVENRIIEASQFIRNRITKLKLD